MSIFNPFTWMAASRLSVDEEIAKKPIPLAGPPTVSKPRLLTTAELLKHYGDPGDPANLITIAVPYPMRLAWDLTKPVSKVLCHKKIATPLTNVLNDLLKAYGTPELKRLEIDLFGGLYNFRPQRGLEKKYEAARKAGNNQLATTYLSRHSWATAIDLNPAKNGLKTKSPAAQFSKPEYAKMNDIFYKHGFIGYGRERNNDWMHFEIGMIL